MRIRRGWVLAACLLLVAPNTALAVSNHYPNDKDLNTHNVGSTDTGYAEVALHFQGNKCPDVVTGLVLLNGPATTGIIGEIVSPTLAKALCVYANGNGTGPYTLENVAEPLVTNCSHVEDNRVVNINFKGKDPSGPCSSSQGFTLTKGFHDDFYEVTPRGSVKIDSVMADTPPGISSPGNSIGMDILSNWLVRVNPDPEEGYNGDDPPVLADPPRSDGVVTFSVEEVITGRVFSFNVDTTGKTDDDIHDEIAAGYNGLQNQVPPGPKLKCKKHGAAEAHGLSGQSMRKRGNNKQARPSYGGAFVRCKDVEHNVHELGITGVKGQEIVTETTAGPGADQIPTLSTWGLALLLGGLLLIGTWLLRRRQAGQTA